MLLLLLLLLLLNSIRCTTLSVSVFRPIRVLFPLLLTLLLVVLLLVLLFPPPLFIVVVLHHKTTNRDHPSRPFYGINPSLYRDVPDLFSSLSVRSCSSSSSSSSYYSYRCYYPCIISFGSFHL